MLLAAFPASSHAYRLPEDLAPIAGNPANRLVSMPIDDEVYDPATHCNPAPHKGVQAAIRWLGRHSQGINWGSYRCEKWGAGGSDVGKYDYCYGRNGKRKKHLNPTAAHMDHVHIGFSKAGARGQTSFWRVALKKR